MKKILIIFLLVLLCSMVMAAPSAFVKKSGNFCTYICFGRGGASINQCDPAKFNCSVFLGVLFQQSLIPAQLIPCDAIPFIQQIFPSLLGDCGIVIPEKDVFISNINITSSMTIVDSGRQTVTIKVRNTSDNPAVANLTISIYRLTQLVAQCSYSNLNLPSDEVSLGKNGAVDSIQDLVCTFRPNGQPDNPVGKNIDSTFDIVGSYKILAQIEAINPVASDPIPQNDYKESFFAVVKETPKPVPETGWIVLPAIAIVCIYILSRKKETKNHK